MYVIIYVLFTVLLLQCPHIRYKSLKSLPVQSVLRVPVQALNGTETERPFPFRSFLLHLRVKVLQLQLANTAPGFVLTCRRLPAFPQQKQQNQQNLW